jgi:hypothetical protein
LAAQRLRAVGLPVEMAEWMERLAKKVHQLRAEVIQLKTILIGNTNPASQMGSALPPYLRMILLS